MASLDRKPFIPSDFLKFEFVSDAQISPDASRVAFVRTVVDAKTNKYRSAIMVAPTVSAAAGAPASAGSALPFTSGLTTDSSPRWSPDGCYLAFLSGRDPGVGDEEARKKPAPQIWVAPTGGGEARPITALKSGALDFIWASDSRTIAFTSLCKAEGPEYLDDPPKKDAPKEAATAAPKEAPRKLPRKRQGKPRRTSGFRPAPRPRAWARPASPTRPAPRPWSRIVEAARPRARPQTKKPKSLKPSSESTTKT